MTAPDPNTIAAVVEIGHKERDAAALLMKRVHLSYHAVIAILALIFCFVFYEGWEYHLAKLARLEAAASVEKTRATNEHKLGEAWKLRALASVDSFRVDTLKVKDLVFRVRVDTMVVHVVDSAGVPSEVPMEVVAKLDYDSLGAMCERTQHDCASALAAKDSALSHADSMAAALTALNHNTEQRLSSVKRAALVKEGGIAALFYLLGRILR
jgi:hypothetical protein